jgi:very-short-patch-repair endonuclease
VNWQNKRLEFRRGLRRASTDAERLLWRLLRAKRLAGIKFRRQHPIGPYVLDLYSPAARLALEADGGQHFTPEREVPELARTEYLARRGIRVMRFTNLEILLEPEVVLEAIWTAVSATIDESRG